SGRADIDLVKFQGNDAANALGPFQGNWAHRLSIAKGSAAQIDNAPALVFEYHMEKPNQRGGLWYALGHFDARGYDAVEFEVRGSHGGEMLSFGLKDDRWFEDMEPVAKYLPKGITTEWQKVRIPLADFTRVRQWYSLDNWTLSASNGGEGEKSGKVFVRHLRFAGEGKKQPPPNEPKEVYPLEFDPAKASDAQIWEALQKSAFLFFWNEADAKRGLVKDACYAYGPDGMQSCSIASVGFGLSAICVAEKRGWITHDQAYERVLNTLRFFANEADQVHGFYYHFYDMDTGERSGDCEVSSIDSGLLFYGVISAKQFYPNTEAATLADNILDRVEWDWMQLPGGDVLSMGCKPGEPLFDASWRHYNEGVMLYPLAIGSRTHPIDPKVWNRVEREVFKLQGRDFVPGSGDNALFTHQYPQCWLDLRRMKDKKGINYFRNSIEATKANREWCLANAAHFKSFAGGYWGLTAADAPKGYAVNGAPGGKCDGTVAPTAALASVVFTPDLATEAARKFFTIKDKIWGRYGFVDAFNLAEDWYSTRYIGIDQGPIVLMAQNQRDEMIWKLTMQEPSVKAGLQKMGFEPDSGGPGLLKK
ncbi:MAG: hypothetical protein JO317_03300, partial [Verrucomicrobiae bacterium]|nr:hypothetical protein [Verrucomicrobiae bacterium]